MALKSRARTSAAGTRQRPSLRALRVCLPLLLLLPAPAAAQQIALEFHEGRVSEQRGASDFVRIVIAPTSVVPEPRPPPPARESPLAAASDLLKQFRQVGLGVPD